MECAFDHASLEVELQMIAIASFRIIKSRRHMWSGFCEETSYYPGFFGKRGGGNSPENYCINDVCCPCMFQKGAVGDKEEKEVRYCTW